MIILVSPYHMTTREPAAMASLALAEYVVTAMPTPAGAATREAVTQAAERVSYYADLMHRWEWARPLFDAGVCGTAMSGEDPLDDILNISRAIDEDDRYAGLRPFMRTVLEEQGDDMLRALCRDVIRTGPDPAISVPVTASLDRFAYRHDLVVVGLVSVTLAELPVDAVLTASSLAAASVLGHLQPEIPGPQGASLRVLQIAPIGGRTPRR